jgi:hypothetical protein
VSTAGIDFIIWFSWVAAWRSKEPAAHAEARFHFRFWFQLPQKAARQSSAYVYVSMYLHQRKNSRGIVVHPDHSASRGRSKDFLNKG